MNPSLSLNPRPCVRLSGKAFLIAVVGMIAACVTVNVNFPESAVQQAANDFVSDLYKGEKTVANADAKTTDSDAAALKGSMKKTSKKKVPQKVPASVPASAPAESKPTSFQITLFDSAYAIELNTGTPKALELKRKMAARVGDLQTWKQKGVVCETADGMVKLAAPGKAGADAGKVSALVKAENNDRDELYSEIKSANRMSSDAPVRKSFAGAFRENSPAQAKCD